MRNQDETTSLLRPDEGAAQEHEDSAVADDAKHTNVSPADDMKDTVTSKLAFLAVLALVIGCTNFTGSSLRYSTTTSASSSASNLMTQDQPRSTDIAYLEQRIDLWEFWKQHGTTVALDRLYLHTKHYSNKDWEAVHHFPIYLNHTDAYAHLLSDGHKGAFRYSADYFAYQQGLDAQVNQAFCAVATSVALLNSLRGLLTTMPQDPIYSPYPYATQTDVLNECVKIEVIRQDAAFPGILSAPFGLSLQSATGLLQCNVNADDWDVQVTHVDPDKVSLSEMRTTLKDALRNPDARVMVNYERTSVGQVGGGHFSPIGAYSSNLDAFLVMDVAKYKYPMAWISAEMLHQSLSTVDVCGSWDGPAAQQQLPPNLLHPATLEDMEAAKRQLNCQPMHRGFIVVSKK